MPRKTLPGVQASAGAILLLLLIFAQALNVARSASITFDEGPHLAVGYTVLRTGDLRLQPVHIHPPLANVLAAAPLLLDPSLPDPRSVPGWEINSLSAISDAVVWQNPQPARLALAARLPIILLSVLAGALVWRWAADWGGPWSGLLALALYALDPNLTAHGSLVTTDMAVTALGLLTFFLLHRYQCRPSRARLAGVGLALGLALASKVSAMLLAPLALAALLLPGAIRPTRSGLRGSLRPLARFQTWRRGLLAWLTVLLLALLALWAVYGFELPPTTHLKIYHSLQEHYQLGHPAFLHGANSDQGWWYYFPLAFLIKTPLPTLLLLALALFIFITRRRPLSPALALFPLAHLFTALFSSVNIGYRHLLPALPFIYIFIAKQWRVESDEWRVPTPWPSARNDRGFALRFTLDVLLFWLALETAFNYPHYLSYFNELAGGSSGGYNWLVDSNLDWGQNLWQLRDWMRDEGVERVYYAHFSPARPQVYGVRADWLPPDPRAVPFAPLDPAPGVYAIGATVLQGAYTPDVNTFSWFRARQPLARLGHALFIYQVPRRNPPLWLATCNSSRPLPSSEALRAGLGHSDLRLITPDCQQSWVYPTYRQQPALYVTAPGSAPPPNATLEMTARQPDGSPFYKLYRLQGPEPWPLVPDVTLDGPLDLLGYRQQSATAQPGATVELLRVWYQVDQVPARPLSLMAHLLGPDGLPIAVADGLGLPIEQWQEGDVIVQRHHFTIPQDTPPGEYTLYIGAYWLDTLERWPTQNREGQKSDQLKVGTIHVQP